MRIAFRFPVRLIDAFSGSELGTSGMPPIIFLTDDRLDTYLDAELADAGVVGGEVSMKRTANGQPVIEVAYWFPGTPGNGLVSSLRAYTVSQLADGVGEGGFPFDFAGKRCLVIADTEVSGTVDVKDDGRHITEPPRIAMAARDGDLPRMVTEIEAAPGTIDRLHQGCTALHLAILYGHRDAIPLLLAADANPNVLDAQGNTPLETCALSNHLDDVQSRDVARLLLNAGANPLHRAPDGECARSYAESRRKSLLAAIL